MAKPRTLYRETIRSLTFGELLASVKNIKIYWKNQTYPQGKYIPTSNYIVSVIHRHFDKKSYVKYCGSSKFYIGEGMLYKLLFFDCTGKK